MDRNRRIFIHAALAVALVFAAGCKKKIPPPPVPPPPPPAPAPAPTAQITASPTVVVAGATVVLNWNTTNATAASIDGIGAVALAGSRTVTPTASTSYHLVAKGAGGSAEASVRVTVNQPPPPPPPAPAPSMTAEEEFKANVNDIYFDYDKSNIRPDAKATLAQDASYFSSHPNIKILIAGNCDERGSAEYNLALGENRASAAKKALVDAGIEASRIRVISYGKEKPICTDSNEACYQKNRRDGFSLDR